MTDRTVLITGASGGIGSAVAEEFAAAGWQTVLCGRSADALAVTAEAVSGAGGTPVTHEVDVRDETEVFYALAECVPETLDVVIPAAATIPHAPGERPLDEDRYEDVRTVLDTNVYGLFAVIRESLAFMHPEGRVLVPSGSVAREPTPGMGMYAPSKAAAEAIARGFAADVDQTVGVVDPGVVATDLTDGKGRDPADVAGMFRWAALECPPADLDGEIVGLREWKQATR
ncbi:MAG: NAD(P)-dependent oxidoreductase [Halobacteriales archaeon SW_9_67_25]|jgi:NAD(P)-dependent dehydrogenase (short-subunit alcohol dehydrogenase family)|nr:MAG: NAD(P)-dependent oxidoreductase [Halobacteriales archaeon SW_9_67_25]